MAGALMSVTTGTGGLAAALATAGLCVTVGAGGIPAPALIAILVAAVVVLAIGFVSNFEHQSRLWANQMEAELQTRRHGLKMLKAVAASSLPVCPSQSSVRAASEPLGGFPHWYFHGDDYWTPG